MVAWLGIKVLSWWLFFLSFCIFFVFFSVFLGFISSFSVFIFNRFLVFWCPLGGGVGVCFWG